MKETLIILACLSAVLFGILHGLKRYRHSDSNLIVAAKTSPVGCLGALATAALTFLGITLIPTENFPRVLFAGYILASYFIPVLVGMAAGALIIRFMINKLAPASAKRPKHETDSMLLFLLFAGAFLVSCIISDFDEDLEPSYENVPIPQIEEKIEIASVVTNSFFGESDHSLKITWTNGETITTLPVSTNSGGNKTFAIYYIPPTAENPRRGIMTADRFGQKILNLDTHELFHLDMNPPENDPGDVPVEIPEEFSFQMLDTAYEQDWDTAGRKIFIGLYESSHFFKASLVDEPDFIKNNQRP